MKHRKRRPALRIDDDSHGTDDDSQPLMVPRSDRALVPTAPERLRRLRKHLLESLLALRRMHDPGRNAAPLPPDLAGFAARVAQTACTLCKGWCCKGGGEHAYVDERTMARVRQAMPGVGNWSLLRLYLQRVPQVGYAGSCVFHGEQGCTLDRSLRSDVCNSYFCGGLGAFVTRGDLAQPVVVMAGRALEGTV